MFSSVGYIFLHTWKGKWGQRQIDAKRIRGPNHKGLSRRYQIANKYGNWQPIYLYDESESTAQNIVLIIFCSNSNIKMSISIPFSGDLYYWLCEIGKTSRDLLWHWKMGNRLPKLYIMHLYVVYTCFLKTTFTFKAKLFFLSFHQVCEGMSGEKDFGKVNAS